MEYKLVINPDEFAEFGATVTWKDGELAVSNLVGVYRGSSEWRETFQRWEEYGLSEWVNVPGRRTKTYRVTVVGEPEFLPRIQALLENSYCFETELAIINEKSEG